MRALIRVEIVDPKCGLPPRANRAEYDPAIISLFGVIGYDARHLANACSLPTQGELEQSKDVEYLFEGVPDRVKDEEMKHLIMLGYTSEGQAKFILCSINQTILHIRVRDDLFDKLRRACKEICRSVWDHSARQIKRSFLLRKSSDKHFRIKGPIEVMEPGHGHPTIIGQLVRHPLASLFKNNPGESALALVTLAIAVVMFWKTPEFAPALTAWLAHFKTFKPEYIQGVLERIYSAFLVTFFVTLMDLIIRYRELRRGRPIVWNAGIEPTKIPRTSD
jgi:hypothetical protein